MKQFAKFIVGTCLLFSCPAFAEVLQYQADCVLNSKKADSNSTEWEVKLNGTFKLDTGEGTVAMFAPMLGTVDTFAEARFEIGKVDTMRLGFFKGNPEETKTRVSIVEAAAPLLLDGNDSLELSYVSPESLEAWTLSCVAKPL